MPANDTAGAIADTPTIENHGGAQRSVGWFLVGAGAVGLGVGAYFFSQWLNDRNDSNPHCVGDVCDPAGSQLRNDATTQGRAAIISGGSGVVALVVGGILAATAPSAHLIPAAAPVPATGSGAASAKGIRSLELVPIVDPHRGGLSISGVF
jgi:serine/threonine-protein kinase